MLYVPSVIVSRKLPFFLQSPKQQFGWYRSCNVKYNQKHLDRKGHSGFNTVERTAGNFSSICEFFLAPSIQFSCLTNPFCYIAQIRRVIPFQYAHLLIFKLPVATFTQQLADVFSFAPVNIL